MEKSCKDCKFYEPYTDDNKDNFIMICDIPDVRSVKFTNTLTCLTWFEPKNETKAEEKLYTTGEMIDLLLENPERRSNSSDGLTAKWVEEDGRLIKCEGIYGFNITSADKDRKWQIIEPEPQKVSFVEAWKAHTKRDKIIVSNIGKEYKFSVNGLFWATDEEIDGEWIVLD